MGLEYPACLREHVRVLRRVNQVLRSGESESGQVAQMIDDPEDVLARGGQPRPDRCPAEIHYPQSLFAFVDPPAIASQCVGIGRHLPPHRHQHRVLQLGAANLHYMCGFLFLLLKSFLERDDLSFEATELPDSRYFQGGRIRVVC